MTFYNSGNARDTPNGAANPRETLLEALRWMTVYESANAATPRNRLQRVVKRNGDLLSNSGALMATSVLTSLLGFVYWWVADRSFSAEAVGAASAGVSAMTLVGTLGMFGMGTLLISELPKSKNGQWSLISTCVMVAAAASTLGGLIYVGLALFAIPGLRSSLGSPLGIALLVLAMGLNGAMLVFDEGLVGLLLGHLQLLRNAYFAVGKLIVLGIVAILPVAVTGSDILGAWVAGILLSLPLLWLSLRSRGIGPIRPRLSALRGLGRNAMDHNLLNVALFLPRTSLPLVVTSVISTRANAAFYTAWMVMTFLAMIPGSIATTLFAVASGDMAGLRARVRTGLVVALGIGVPLSTGISVLARPIMSVFGDEYAASASGVLSVLALTYVVGVVRQFYVAISRVKQRARRASYYAVLIGIMELGAAWIGGSHGGLTGLVAWLAGAFAVEGLFMAPAVVRVALARVAASPQDEPAAGQSTPASTSQAPAAPVVPARPRKKAPTPPGEGDRTMVIPRPRTDDTMVISRLGAGDTAVLARLGAEETQVVASPEETQVVASPEETQVVASPEETQVVASPEETQVVASPRADETMVISRPRGETTPAPDRIPLREPTVNPWFTADAKELFTPVAADDTAVIPRTRDDTAAPRARRQPRADETAAAAGPRADETAVIPRLPGDDTAVIPRLPADPSAHSRTAAIDETVVIPRPRADELAQPPPRAT